MPFDASAVVEPLGYTFAPYAADGTVPEPTSRQIRAFARWMQEPFGGEDQEDMAKAYAAFDEETSVKYDAEAIGKLVDLCSGQPSAEDLEKLPPRVLRHFMLWLWGELTNSTAATVGNGR